MKSSVIVKPHSDRLLTVKVSPAELGQFFTQALDKLRSQIKVDGFRAGRVPDDVILQKLGRAAVEHEALDLALTETYPLALREHRLSPVASPTLEVKKHLPAAGDQEEVALEYTALVTVMPEVTIKDLAGLRVEQPEPVAPTDDEINKVLDYLRRQKAIFKELDRPAQKGDWVDIGYRGQAPGVKSEQLTNEHHPLILGESQLIPGFEEELIGMTKGEQKTFTLRFPKEYHAPEVAGRRAEFTVTLHELKEIVRPEFDAVFAKDFGFADPYAMRAAVTKNLADEKKNEATAQLKEAALRELEKRVKADIPPLMFEQELDRLLHDLRHRLEDQKLPWESYLTQIKRTEEELKKDLRPQAERNVRLGLALGAIVKEQKIKISDEGQVAEQAVDWLVKLATGQLFLKK